MVRSQTSIEKYINLIGVSYTLVTLLPFMHTGLKQNQFQSPQETRYAISESVTKDLIFSKLLEILQLRKNVPKACNKLKYLIRENLVS